MTGANIDVLLRLWDEGVALFGTPAYEFSVKVYRSSVAKIATSIGGVHRRSATRRAIQCTQSPQRAVHAASLASFGTPRGRPDQLFRRWSVTGPYVTVASPDQLQMGGGGLRQHGA